MIGNSSLPGVMVLTMRDLFRRMQSNDHEVKISYLEIYNETIRDLLVEGN